MSIIKDAKSFLAIIPTKGAWGKAETFDGAIKNAKREGGVSGKIDLVVIAFEVEKESVKVEGDVDLRYTYPINTTAIRIKATL